MSRLTTHVLDTANGVPAEGMAICLYRERDAASQQIILETSTNAQGRTDEPLIEGEAFEAGLYRLDFGVADYFRNFGVEFPEIPFLGVVSLRFGIQDSTSHFHVPLLVSPYGYSTYRGS